MVYALGGKDVGGEPLSSVERLQPLNNFWASGRQLKIPRCNFAAVAHGLTIMVMGGVGRQNDVLDSCERFDISTAKWESTGPMLAAKHSLAAVSHRGALYVIGGVDKAGKRLAAVDIYFHASDSWENFSTLKIARSACAAACLGQHIYVAGGRANNDKQACMRSVERCNPGAGAKWEEIAPMCQARRYCAAASLGAAMYVLGGEGADGDALASCERFDVAAGVWDNWHAIAPMRVSRRRCAATTLGTTIYVLGGEGKEGWSGQSSCEAYDPAMGEWVLQPELSAPRTGCAVVAL
eukprot:3328057-Amphidinium_carterae.1